MSKIIFVNPQLTLKERYGVDGKSGGETPPLGLAHLAAVTRDMGYDTEIYDASAERTNCEDTVDLLVEKDPDYIGFTAATIAINKVGTMTKLLKKKKPDIRIMIGGAHFTALPFETLEMFPGIDLGVYGEGEVTIQELLNEWENGQDFSAINGIVWRDGEKIRQNPARERVKNLDELPYPAWELFPDLAHNYSPPVHTLKKFPAAILVTSRGCPFKCNFCDRSLYGRFVTYHSAEFIMKMIRDLYHNYGVREVQFRDDLFITDKKRVMKLCDMLIEENLDLAWSATGRVDIVNEALLKRMAEAGCWQMWYGIESGDDRILDEVDKKTTVAMSEHAVKLTKEAGMDACGFFILGHMTETIESIERTIDFSCELDLDEAHFSYMIPLPGTPIYALADQYGTFNKNWDKMNGWEPLFVPKNLTADQLRHYSNMAHRKFYYRPRIVFNYLKRCKSLKHFKTYLSGFHSLVQFQRKNRNDMSVSFQH